MESDYKKYLTSLFSEKNTIPKYIFGMNVVASQVLKQIASPCGIIDEFTDRTDYDGIPVIHNLEECEKHSIILNCVFSIHAVGIQRRLNDCGFSVIDIFSFLKYSNCDIVVPHYTGFSSYYEKYIDDFDWLYNRLEDFKSKEVLVRMIDFRYNNNLDALSAFKNDLENQYFESFLNLKQSGESFVDAGAYDGVTSEQFIKRCPGYTNVFVIEPGEEFLKTAKERFKNNKGIHYLPYAVNSKKDVLFFKMNGLASSVSNGDGISVNADSIDNLISKPVSFIKMDIEGSESSAIEGARKTILKNWPIIAISVYHLPDDYISIPKHILSIRNDYRIYMRHYTEGVDETVMYFVPQNR